VQLSRFFVPYEFPSVGSLKTEAGGGNLDQAPSEPFHQSCTSSFFLAWLGLAGLSTPCSPPFPCSPFCSAILEFERRALVSVLPLSCASSPSLLISSLYPRSSHWHGAHCDRNYTLHHQLSEQDPGTIVYILTEPTPTSSSAISRKALDHKE
jgi:hypothetical protein